MDAGPSAVILFVRKAACDARSRTVVMTSVPRDAAVTSAVILFVRRATSDPRSRRLVVTPVSGGAASMSAVILFVRRAASDARSRRLVVTPVSGGAEVTRMSAGRGSKPPGDVNGLDGFCAGTLMPMLLTAVG